MTKVTLIKRSFPVCPACNVMQAALEGEEIHHEVIDITESPEAIKEYDLTGVPALIIEREGKGTVRLFGLQQINTIKEALQ